MFKGKRAVSVVLSAAMILSMGAAAGCSTPEVAMTVGDTTYSTGDYLAYLYNTYSQVYQNYNFAMYAQYGMDPWEITIPYGDDEEEMAAEDYIVKTTQDAMIRQKAIKDKLEEYGLSPRQEDLDAVNQVLETISNDDTISLGFSKDTYSRMYTDFYCNEKALFYGLYDKGGQREISDDDIRAYFEENYLTYKIISLPLTDSEGADLGEEEAQEVRDRLQKYLDMYNESGDFDAVIEQYNEDENSSEADDSEDTDTTTSDTDTTTAGEETTTTAAETTTTEGTTSTTAAETTADETGTTTTGSGEDTGEDSGEEEETDPNLHDIDAKLYGDEDFTNAVKSVPVGEAQIVEYKAGGTDNTAALILRLDPEEGTDRETYFEDNRENIIYGLKYEEFNEELKEYITTLDYTVDKTVEKKCRPKNFVSGA